MAVLARKVVGPGKQFQLPAFGRAVIPHKVFIVGADKVQERPVEIEIEFERSALVGPALVVVGGRNARSDRLQMRRPGAGCQPLGGAHVGAAEHADVAVAPVLGGNPLDRVVAVVGLVDERVPLPLGLEPSAAILNDHRVA